MNDDGIMWGAFPDENDGNTDASCLGWLPGRWPAQLTVHHPQHGRVALDRRSEVTSKVEEVVIGMKYSARTGRGLVQVTVYND